MNREIFFELVELKAKTASVLPFLLGICFSWYQYGRLHVGYVLIFFIAMFIFNMAVDILDNYNDYHHATEVHDYKEKTNIIGRENLSLPLIRKMIFWMILVSALMGIGLSFIVGWPLLIMGLYCYLIGIFYSSGPKPLSSLPLGEVFSGFTMGFMITLICVYINTFEVFNWSVANLWGRYTLVHYLGKASSLKLFVGLNTIAMLAILLAVGLGLTPPTMLLMLLTLPFVRKQTQALLKEQVKSKTFVCAVKILAVGATAQVLFFAIGLWWL